LRHIKHPRVWRDKCHDYFRVFNVSPMLWVTTTTLHMDGNAAIWLQAFRQRHDIGQWPQFITSVEAEFGADDQCQSMKALLNLKQHGTVNEYFREFQALMYWVTMYNPHYDNHFFVTQFVKGLRSDLRAMVKAQLPDTLECVVFLARVHQEILAVDKPRPPKATPFAKAEVHNQRPAIKLGHGDLWKDRQLRDYRRANNLYFKCGEKYDPTHQCGAKPAATLNALQAEPGPEQLSEEVLNMLELQDIAAAEQLSLSLHALAGSESDSCFRLRALVGNQVLIILVDSESSSSFINAQVLHGLNCATMDAPALPMKLANGEIVHTTKLVPELTWWCQDATFTTLMRVLELGGYDAILGIDWLKLHSPMTTDWQQKFITFHHQGKNITLHGVPTPPGAVREIPVEQLAKWSKGNEV
jgi:hypothetical protein